MHVRHRIAIAALLGCGSLSGTFALAKTVHLGADAKKPAAVDAAAIAARQAELDAAAHAAEVALARKTPPLPEVPKVGPVAIPVLPPIVVSRPASTRRAASTASTRSNTSPRPAAKTAASRTRPAHHEDDDHGDAKDRRDEPEHEESGR